MNRAAAILTKMKRSEQKQIRDDERRILDALRSSGTMSDLERRKKQLHESNS